MSTFNLPEFQSTLFAIIYPAARNLLLTNDYVNLRTLIKGTSNEEDVEDFLLLDAALDHVCTEEDATKMYEHLLNQLEQDYGPLIYRAQSSGSTDLAWGYAAPISDSPLAKIVEKELTRYQVSQMWVNRLFALNNGHPDQADYAKGDYLPSGSWYRSPQDDNASI